MGVPYAIGLVETWKTYSSRGLCQSSVRDCTMYNPYGKLLSIDLVKVQDVFGNHGRLGDGWWLLLVHIGVLQNSDAITLIVSCTSLLGQ